MLLELSPSELIIPRPRESPDDGIRDLAKSIEAVGCLHPVIVIGGGDGYVVVAGRRRVRAHELLDRLVPVRICDNLDTVALQLQAERDENSCRIDLLPSEKARLALELELIEKPLAAAREQAGKAPSGNLPEGHGETREKIATAIDVSPRTASKLLDVARVAEDPGAPPRIREAAKTALAEMDQTGKIDGPHRRFKAALAPSTPIRSPLPNLTPNGAHLRLPEWEPLLTAFRTQMAAVLKCHPDVWERAMADLTQTMAELRPAAKGA